MLFGSARDVSLFKSLSRELISDIVEQEILYYKFSIADSSINLYGESLDKGFYTPVKLNCLITRGDQVYNVDEFGADLGREASFAFLREDLTDKLLVPEVGDIINWHEDYYEIDTLRENQLVLGRDNSYNLTNYGSGFGASYSIIADCHITRADKVGINQIR